MGFVQETDVRTLLQDKTLVNNIIQAVAKAPEVMSELAEDVVDGLEKDLGFRKKIVAAATSTPKFKTQVIKTLVEEITD